MLAQACNANSSAVLGLLVRIFSNGGAILRQAGAGEEEEAEAGPEGLCRRLIIAVLRFDPAAPPGGEDVFYGLAGDSAGRQSASQSASPICSVLMHACVYVCVWQGASSCRLRWSAARRTCCCR